jgi:hypothetical protein
MGTGREGAQVILTPIVPETDAIEAIVSLISQAILILINTPRENPVAWILFMSIG